VSTNFPTSLDSFVDPEGNQSLNNPPHSAQHANANDAIAALQVKVGIDDSADVTSLDYIAKNAVPNTQVGEANGIAALNSDGFVPLSELPIDATVIMIPGAFGGNAPNNDIGLNNDYALDIDTGNVWGPKSGSVWPGSPANAFGTSNGSSPGYRQLTVTYNGGDPFLVDAMVGEGYSPSDGALVFGMLPYSAVFGGDSTTVFPASIYIDPSNVITSFAYSLPVEGSSLNEGVDDSGNVVGYVIQGPNGAALGIDGSGNIILEAENGTWTVQQADGRLSFPAGNSIYTYANFSDFSGSGSAGDVGIAPSGGQPYFLVNAGGTWIPYPYNIGYCQIVTSIVHSDSTSENATITTVTPRTYGEGPPPGYTSQYSDQCTDMNPLNQLLNTDSIQIAIWPNLQPNLFDTVNLNGELTVWDAAGANIMLASFNISGLNDSSNETVLGLTQQQLIGSDLSIANDNSVVSAAGGSYNVLVQMTAGWD